jgi:beta-lactamase superfamily II metal-dependent hydrolase
MKLAQERSIPDMTAVLLADGGFSAVNPPEWLGQLRPWLVMISVEAGNNRGLPSPTVLQTLEGTTVLRTDLHGWIELTSDGKQLWVEVERDIKDKINENE